MLKLQTLVMTIVVSTLYHEIDLFNYHLSKLLQTHQDFDQAKEKHFAKIQHDCWNAFEKCMNELQNKKTKLKKFNLTQTQQINWTLVSLYLVIFESLSSFVKLFSNESFCVEKKLLLNCCICLNEEKQSLLEYLSPKSSSIFVREKRRKLKNFLKQQFSGKEK